MVNKAILRKREIAKRIKRVKGYSDKEHAYKAALKGRY